MYPHVRLSWTKLELSKLSSMDGGLSLSLSTALNGFAEDQRQCCISATVSTVELAMVCCVEGLDVATLKAIYKDLLMTSELS